MILPFAVRALIRGWLGSRPAALRVAPELSGPSPPVPPRAGLFLVWVLPEWEQTCGQFTEVNPLGWRPYPYSSPQPSGPKSFSQLSTQSFERR